MPRSQCPPAVFPTVHALVLALACAGWSGLPLLASEGPALSEAVDPFYRDLAQRYAAWPHARSHLGLSEAATLEALQQNFKPNGGSQTVIAVEDMAFSQALRITVPSPTEQPWQLRYEVDSAHPVQKGDVLALTFYVRGRSLNLGGVSAIIDARLRHNGPPYVSNWIGRRIDDVGVGWQRYDLVSRATKDAVPELRFNLGFLGQEIDLGGIAVTNFGRDTDPGALPQTELPELTYTGREADAVWRQEARQRIEEIRKDLLQIQVVDAEGQPVPGASVAVAMQRHAFVFGTAGPAVYINPQFEKAQAWNRYRERILENFNSVSFGNELKWPRLPNPVSSLIPENSQVMQAWQWLDQHDLSLYGHVLLWPSWQHSPDFLKQYRNDPERLRAVIEDHIRSVVRQMRGKVFAWDVINESINNNDITQILGETSLADWFKIAREEDPDVILAINEAEVASERLPARDQQYYDMIQMIIDQGAPLDAIGFQCHQKRNSLAPVEILENLRRFDAFGKRLHVTEYDIKVASKQTEETRAYEADYTRDFYIAAFSHPTVDVITMWGFSDRVHWKQNAPLYQADLETLKPSGQAWKDLVFDEWWTEETVTTAADGRAALRGFLGDYRITASAGGRSATATTTLSDGGSTVTIRLE
jgi:endo-1,4-beta-xylanase